MTTYGNNHNASESNHIVLSRWISNKDKNNDNHTSNICKEESNSNLRSSNSTPGGSWRRQFGVEGRWADRWWDVGSEMAWLSKVTVVTGGIWWSHPVNPHKSTWFPVKQQQTAAQQTILNRPCLLEQLRLFLRMPSISANNTTTFLLVK